MTAFTPDGYRALLQRFLDAGYSAVDYAEAVADAPHLILRHDVDQSLQSAVRLSEEETALGLSATYFVLLRTEMYNPLSRDGLAALTTLIEGGHRIGLHFDPTLYDGDLDDAAAMECAIFERALGSDITTVSFHRPAKEFVGSGGRIAGRINAYAARFVTEIEYCSDSGGRWGKGGAPLERAAFQQRRALQLLTHPIWWDAAAEMSNLAKLHRLVDLRTERLKQELAANCKVYTPSAGGDT